jgi:hypothetical protein
MTHVAVQCPECGRFFVVNGRGVCRCGAYLVHHAGKSFTLRERRYFSRDDRQWIHANDVDGSIQKAWDEAAALGHTIGWHR